MTERDIADRLLAVVRDVYEDGKAIIGERWSILKKMKEMADRGDAVGMLQYFERCLQSERGKRVAEKLRAAGKRTLETESERVGDIVGDALVEAKLSCLCAIRDESRRKRLQDLFQEYWRKDLVASAIQRAIARRLRQKCGIGLAPEAWRRLDAVPFVFMRHGGSGFDRLRQLLEQAGEAYLLRLSEASAVLGRAALEVLIKERLYAAQGGRRSEGQSDVDLSGLIALALRAKTITKDQESLAQAVTQTGNKAAHGEVVSEADARGSLAKLRKLLVEF